MEGNMKILQNERAKNNDSVEHRHDASTSNICAKYFSFPSAPQRQDIELLDIN